MQVEAVQKIINTKQYSSTYVKYSPSKWLKIGKYAFEILPVKFQNEIPTLKESTVRECWKKYEKLLKENKAKSPKKTLELERHSWPHRLDNVDEKVSHKDRIKMI